MDYIASTLFCVYSGLLDKNPVILERQKLAEVQEWELQLKLPYLQNFESKLVFNFFSVFKFPCVYFTFHYTRLDLKYASRKRP